MARTYGHAFGTLVMLLQDREAMLDNQLRNARTEVEVEGWSTSGRLREVEGAISAVHWVQDIVAALIVEVE